MSEASYLIVKLGALGDVLMATALARALRVARPGARIGFLTGRECLPLLEENPDLDQVIGIELTGSGPSLHPAALWRLRRSLAAWPDATALILHRHPAVALLCQLAGMRHRLGFANERNRWLTDAAPFDLRRHRMERQEQLLHRLGVNAPARRMRLVLRRREQAWGESVWRQMQAGRLRLVLAPGGGKNRWSEMPNRRWPVEHFRDLARRAGDAGFAVQVIGGPGEQDLARRVAEDTGAACNGAGVWNLRETAAVIAAAHLVVSNDSLPLFLSAAMQVPVAGLYGPTDSHLIHPPGAGPALQGAVACGPCYAPTQGTQGMAYRCPRACCMEALTPDFVWSEIGRWVPLPVPGRLA